MAGYVIIGALAAFGLLCSVWTVFGLLPTGKRQGVLLVFRKENLGFLRRCLWLRDMGLLDATLGVPEQDLTNEEIFWLRSQGIEIYSPRQLCQWLGLGAEENGAGTGDPPGCHQCGGVPQL